MSFGYQLFISFYNKLNVYLTAVFSSLIDSFGGFAVAFVTLYIVLAFIDLMFTNKIIQSWEQAVEFSMSIIISIALLGAMEDDFRVYKEWIVDPVVNTTTDLATFFINTVNNNGFATGGGIKSLFMNLDSLSDKLFEFIMNYNPPGSFLKNAWGYMQAGFLVVSLFAAYAGAYVVFLALLILGYFSLYVLLLVGGICIFFAPFKKTRFIFISWIRAIVNYALVIVFTSIIMSICYFGLNQEITDLIKLEGSNALFTTQYLSALCWSLLTFGVLLKGPDFAAALSGGQAGSTSGIAAGMGMVASAGAGVATAGASKFLGGAASGFGSVNSMYQQGRNMVPDLSNIPVDRPYSRSLGLHPDQQKK